MKAGFITIIGKTNAGKSTLLNTILQKKVAIATAKAQTTRNAIQGIYNSSDVQMIFIDTPGLVKPHHHLDDYMKKEALSSLADVEAVIFLIDSSAPIDDAFNQEMKHRLETLTVPLFVVFNKIDLATFKKMEEAKKVYKELFPKALFKEICAKDGFGVKDLLNDITSILPSHEAFYSEETISNHPVSFLLQELIREQLLLNLRDEVPHSCAVKIVHMERKSDSTHIDATIFVERESQKAIVIGKKGCMIRKIGTNARKEIEEILHRKVYLELSVKVGYDWRNSLRLLKDLGYQD